MFIGIFFVEQVPSDRQRDGQMDTQHTVPLRQFSLMDSEMYFILTGVKPNPSSL